MAEYCPGWCESSHSTEFDALTQSESRRMRALGARPEFAGLLHRSSGVEARPLDPVDRPLRCWAEGWHGRDDEWHEAVAIGAVGDAGVQFSAGTAARFGAGMIKQATLPGTLADDPVVLRMALALARAEERPLSVRVQCVATVDADRVARVRYRDGEALVIAVQEGHVSPEAAGELEVLLAALLAEDGRKRKQDG